MAVILVIDDAATVRHLMRRVLVEAAHTVIEAKDGDVGLSLFQAQRPALVITDLFMPNREGIETIQELRRLAPDAKIIAMSSSSTPSGKLYLSAARKLGADAILPKPFKPAELLAAVDNMLAPSEVPYRPTSPQPSPPPGAEREGPAQREGEVGATPTK